MHPSSFPVPKLLEQCLIRRTRHSGPGGQHRNKVETAIEIVHQPTGVVSFAAERRSQDANRTVAIFRMRVLLAIRVRSDLETHVEPTALWQSRCSGERISCNERHEDFPALLAEALDAIHAKDADLRRAAAALGCSPTQLLRFIAKAPDALRAVNEDRARCGLKPLKA